MSPETLSARMCQFESERHHDDIVSRIYLNPEDAVECIRTYHPRQEPETKTELLRMGILGYLHGAVIYARRFIPRGHYVMLGNLDGNDDLKEGWQPTPGQIQSI